MGTTTIRSTLLLSLVLLAIASIASPAPTPEQAIFRVQIETRAGMLEGTCVLVQRESRGRQTVLYFLTSAQLLKNTEADLRAGTRRIRILRNKVAPIEVGSGGVLMPYGNMLDIAVLRVATSGGLFVPLPMVFEPPGPGSVFTISGFGRNGIPATVPERVRFRATFRLLGDRDASGIAGCAGAPAIGERGVFGLVTECAPDRIPSIVPLAAARAFITRNLPAWRVDPLRAPGFDVDTLPASGPAGS